MADDKEKKDGLSLNQAVKSKKEEPCSQGNMSDGEWNVFTKEKLEDLKKQTWSDNKMSALKQAKLSL